MVKQQAYLGQVVEDRLPEAAEWAERQGQSLVAAYNLSQVSNDRICVPTVDGGTLRACARRWYGAGDVDRAVIEEGLEIIKKTRARPDLAI